tara:strand:- start:2254 stop:2694 length:441 start_codon:yes stop_codon:yes gene_type:complete
MKHIKSYEQFLNEAEDKAKEIESKVNKMGEVSDDEKELEKDMEASKDKNAKPKAGKKSEKDNEAKGEEELKDEAPKDEIKEGEVNEMKEKHHLYDDRLLNMGLGKVLDFIKGKDPKAYADIEKYIETNFKDMTPAEEGNFFTTMTA